MMTDLLMSDKITPIEHENFKFLIMDCPTNDNLHHYLKPLKAQGCKHLVRVCEPTYGINPLKDIGITVHEFPFVDGQPPPPNILNGWLDLLDQVEKEQKATGQQAAIAVHCVAGLGRAPVLVATGLIEKGMKPLDAVEHIRRKRKGAFNNKQIQFLDSYKKRSSKGMSLSKSFSRVFRRSNSMMAGSSSSAPQVVVSASSPSLAVKDGH